MEISPYQWFRIFFDIAQTVAIAALGIWGVASRKNSVTNDKIAKITDTISVHNERISELENKTLHHGDLANLHTKINGVQKEVSTMTGKLVGIENNVKLLIKGHIKK